MAENSGRSSAGIIVVVFGLVLLVPCALAVLGAGAALFYLGASGGSPAPPPPSMMPAVEVAPDAEPALSEPAPAPIDDGDADQERQDTTPSTTREDVTGALKPVGGATYHDDFAGLTLEVPPDAVVMANDKVQDLAKETRQVVEERSSLVREAKESGQAAVTLFRLHLKQPATGAAAFLPGIAAWQEEIPEDAEGLTPEQYLMNLRAAMQQASNIEYREEISSKKIDDLTFAFQTGQMEVQAGDQVITGIQEQHVVILGDRAIGFALTYNTEAEGESLRNIVWSLKLDKND